LKRNYLVLIVFGAPVALFIAGAVTADVLMTSRIASRIEQQFPKASGISASIPFLDVPQNLISDSVRAADINIERYSLKGSDAESALAITAANISKSQPTLVGSLDITATIPASTITKNSGLENAQIVGNALQVSVGNSGLGKALLIPKFANNQIFFQLQSVSIFGSQIPASSLPADIQSQIAEKSVRNLEIPRGLKLKSVVLNSKGLSINFRGNNIKLDKLGKSL